MNARLRADAEYIVREAINANIPDKKTADALSEMEFPGRVLVLSVGKAAFPMARAASEMLKDRLSRGIVISKYGHIPHPQLGRLAHEHPHIGHIAVKGGGVYHGHHLRQFPVGGLFDLEQVLYAPHAVVLDYDPLGHISAVHGV